MLYRSGSRVDDFEHNNLTGVYSDDTGVFSISSSVSQQGGFSLTSTDTGDSEIYTGTDHTEIANVPNEGTAFDYWIRSNQAAGSSTASNIRIYFGLADSTPDGEDGYAVLYQAHESDLLFQRFDNGSRTNVSFDLDAYTSYSSNEWIRIRVQWDDGSTFGGSSGDFDVELFDASGTSQSSFSTSDTTYSPTDGDIGFNISGNSGHQVWFDRVTLTTQ